MHIARVDLGYSILREEDHEFGVKFGLHGGSVSAAIGTTAGAAASVEADIVFPLPNLGVYGTYALNDSWAITGHLDFFALDLGDFDGHMINSNLNLVYAVNDYINIGAGYSFFTLDLEYTDDELIGAFDVTYQGPRIFVQIGF